MSASKSHLVVGTVCALTILPVIPSGVRTADKGMVLVQSAGAQTTTEWDDGAGGPDWDADANWDNGVPDSTKDATHTTTLTDIQVNVDGACDDFKGKGGSGNDRFMLLLAGKVLHVFGNLFENGGTGNFLIRLTDGSSGDLTTMDVDGDVTGIDFVAARGNDGDYVELDVSGDVAVSSLTFGDHAVVTVGGSGIAAESCGLNPGTCP